MRTILAANNPKGSRVRRTKCVRKRNFHLTPNGRGVELNAFIGRTYRTVCRQLGSPNYDGFFEAILIECVSSDLAPVTKDPWVALTLFFGFYSLRLSRRSSLVPSGE